MLDMWFNGKRKRAQAVLVNRVNKRSLEELHGTEREITRSSFCKVLYLIPENGRHWDLSQARPVVSRDICTDGLSVVHNQPITAKRVLIGLPEKDDLKFVQCTVQHCSSLGFGFYHIGLFAEEVTNIDMREADDLQKRAEMWDNTPEPSTIA
jgi:hypothetical protein